MIDAADGLRVINEVEQLAAFEWASCQTSQGVRNMLRGLRPGMTEQEAVRLLGWNGWPLSCHLMLTAGPRATFGLLSPGDRPIQRGDRFTTAFGIWGALTCRAGFVVESADELPEPIRDYVDRLVAPYFAAIAEWYATIRIGVTGGQLHEIVERHLGDPFFGIFLNPGHQLHLDEWVNSPIWAGSPIELRSGMCFQVDVIPATGTEYFTTNIEDGIALADEAMRDDLAARFPDAWRRIELRRAFMTDALGIELHPGRPAVLEPPRRPVALPACPGSGHDAGPMTAVEQIVLRGDGVELVVLPELGGRIHRLLVDGADLLRTPDDPATHRDDPFFWGAYLMAPWCNRAPAQPFDVAGRTVRLAPNFPDGSAIHGLVHARPWETRADGSLRIAVDEGEGGWPWAFEATATLGVDGRTVALDYELVNRSSAPMPAGIGLHPWFLGAIGGRRSGPDGLRDEHRFPSPGRRRSTATSTCA